MCLEIVLSGGNSQFMYFLFFSSRRRHTRFDCDWSSDVCSSDLELKDLPNFRRFSYISAFGEGWGLYCEWLGREMGFYTDPYSNFGRLTDEMWRACRLLVGTRNHSLGWARPQAVDYLPSPPAPPPP